MAKTRMIGEVYAIEYYYFEFRKYKEEYDENKIKIENFNDDTLKVRNIFLKKLMDNNIEEFKKDFDGFFGAVTRRYFPGFKQTNDLYTDLKNDAFVFIWNFLNNDHYDANRGKFVTYLYYLIRWQLQNFFRKYNIKRKAEVDISQAIFKPITIKSDSSEIRQLVDFINNTIITYDLHVNNSDVVELLVFNNKKLKYDDSLIYEIKFVSWMIYKKFVDSSRQKSI
jgi:hypothetical protein